MSADGRLHVLHAYKDVYPPVTGGIEKHIGGLRSSVPGCKADVLVCARSPHFSVRRDEEGDEYRVGEYGRVLSVPVSPTYVGWMSRLRPDLYHLHLPFPLAELGAVTALRHRRYVVSYHADIVRQAWLMPVYGPLVKQCLRGSCRIVVGSRSVRDNSPLLAALRDRVTVVPYAVDTDYWTSAAVAPNARAGIRRGYEGPLVVAVGRLVYYKGFEHLIRAAQGLDARVVIAGDGPLRKELAALAAKTTNVTLVGQVDDAELRALLSAADVFVLPSVNHAESFGIATVEAQAMGLPAVVTDVGTGTVEAIEPGATGVVVRPGEATELHDAIRALLNDDERRSRMSIAARERALEIHGLVAAGGAIRQVYAEAIGQLR